MEKAWPIAEAHLALLNLEGEYARTWDRGDAKGWSELFMDDGVFEMAAAGEMPAARIEGRAELAAFCQSIHQGYEGLHLIHTPSLSIEPPVARGWVHFEFRARHEGMPLYVCGVYQILYRETSEGWRIQHRFEQAFQRDAEIYGVPPESETVFKQSGE
ncbi:MAG: nuclear transport factor 2 family protein [Myxococcota bacterium]|nr:nuclear transport factor 2 family protein [Myxococcota bacterium]